LKQLKTLSLIGTRVTDAGLKDLAKVGALEKLYLDETGVTDAGLPELAALKGLRQLFVYNTRVTLAGAIALHKALPRCNVKR
jgi:hypothetical protein